MTKTTTRYGEDWTLEQLQQNGDVLKEYYCRDIIRRGLPSIHFDTTFKLVFANTEYLFDMNDLRHLDLLQYPTPDQRNRTDFITPHFLGIAAKCVMIPCKRDGKPNLLRAQHKIGLSIVEAYFKKKLELLDAVNEILEAISNFEFNETNTFASFYETIYGDGQTKYYRIPF
jgi:hypothetical protein